MAAFDGHKKCARCRDKKLGDDPCVKDQPCSICDSLTVQQRSMLSTPQYQIQKDKKSGLLISPSKVTVVGVVDQEDLGEEEDLPVQASGSGEQEVFSVSHHSAEDFVSKQDFDTLSNQLEEKFARFEALLTRTNIFSTPKAPVTTSSVTTSNQPFFNPAESGATGPVRPLTSAKDTSQKKDKKNKGTGKKGKKEKLIPCTTVTSEAPAPVKDNTVNISLPSQDIEQPAKVDVPAPGSDLSLGSGVDVSISKPAPVTHPNTLSASATGTSGQSFFTDPDVSDFDSAQDKDSEEGEISDSEATEQNEEMNYRETCRAVRAFLGWDHIPDFELSVSDGDRSDNPWKGKHPRKTGKVSVEFPPDDWLCHKMEKLNCRAAEGYPSRAQESAGLKVDQFIRTPKSQSKWYKQHRLRQDSSSRPGRTILVGQILRHASTPSILESQKHQLTLNLALHHVQYLRIFYASGKSLPGKEHTSQTTRQHLIDAQVKYRRKLTVTSVCSAMLLSRHMLRNAPLFSSSLFPDDILATAKQDIAKFESAPSAQGPGPGTGQHSGRKHQSYRYKLYEKKDNRQSGHSSSQSSQPWRQFSHKGRGRGRGRGDGNSGYFFRSSRGQHFK